jgi:hypothetical protein
MLQRSGRLTLIKTLCAVPVYTSINITLPGWLLKAISGQVLMCYTTARVVWLGVGSKDHFIWVD